jgi:excisionase family DNA binding protein
MSDIERPAERNLGRVPEVAAFLNVSRSKVYQMMEARELPYVKLGKSRRVRWSDVHRLIDQNLTGTL